MFLLLALILAILSFSIRLYASGAELGVKVDNWRSIRKGTDTKGREFIRLGVYSSAKALRGLAFVLDLVRTVVLYVGSFVIVIDLVVFILMVCVATYASLFL